MKNILEKMYLRFINKVSERDEYQIQEINKEFAIAGLMLWYANILAMFIMLVVDTINHTLSIGTIINFVVNMLYANYLMWKLKKNRLNDIECSTEEEFLKKKKQIKKSSIKAGLLWTFEMFILMCYVFPYLSSGKISVSLSDIIIWICAGLFFGSSMYVISSFNLKKLY